MADEPIRITVRGSDRRLTPPEHATVHLAVEQDGAVAEEVYAAVAAVTGRLVEAIEAVHDPVGGPVTWWSAQEVRTWARRPSARDGSRLPVVHHARTEVRARFVDVGRLGGWLGEQADLAGLEVEQVEWGLSEQRREAEARQARTRAVQAARAKAQAYADALGLGPVRPVALADAGLLDDPRPVAAAGTFARASASSDRDGLRLVPEEIEVLAEVDATFTADPL